MAVSLLLTLAAFGVVLAFVPLEALGMSANFGPRVILGDLRRHGRRSCRSAQD